MDYIEDLSIFKTSDHINKIKISSKCAKHLFSLPSPFIDKSEVFLNGTVGVFDSIPIEVDDTIEGDYEIIWKES